MKPTKTDRQTLLKKCVHFRHYTASALKKTTFISRLVLMRLPGSLSSKLPGFTFPISNNVQHRCNNYRTNFSMPTRPCPIHNTQKSSTAQLYPNEPNWFDWIMLHKITSSSSSRKKNFSRSNESERRSATLKLRKKRIPLC